MLVYKLLIFYLILFHFVACIKKTKHLTERTGLAYYYLLVYQPEEIRKQQCSQPNAIGYQYVDNDFKTIYCLSNKVTQGLIYDANTMVAVTTDTISPGHSLLCKCPPRGGQWQRGNKVEDNPLPGVTISFIQYTGSDNIPLQYQINYKQQDNLYCISQCSVTDQNTTQYQFLKVR